MSMIGQSPPSVSRAASGSTMASSGMSKLPPEPLDPPELSLASSLEQADRAISVVAAPIEVLRKARRSMPMRRAFSSHIIRARRTASRTSSLVGGGANSPFEHGFSLIGRPGSSSHSAMCGIPPDVPALPAPMCLQPWRKFRCRRSLAHRRAACRLEPRFQSACVLL
jgi:hypothetical protein